MGIQPGIINQVIKEGEVYTNLISDGYHTFGELYEHRFALYIALCKMVFFNHPDKQFEPLSQVWKSKLHSDGTMYPGWFILGIGSIPGRQISYHLPLDKWDEVDFAFELQYAPTFDGHTSQEVIGRLLNFNVHGKVGY